MNKIIFLFLLVLGASALYAQPGTSTRDRLLDQPMQLKSADIKIDADFFTATTVLDLTFSNPHNLEMEGVYRFSLEPGQVITDFKLELNGKLRDGSIEEKWKANNAYNTIVGKRVDPAIVQMESLNNYRLNIYPFAPKGTRRVVITIQQLMQEKEQERLYNLPLSFGNKAEGFSLSIEAAGYKTPNVYKGLINELSFVRSGSKYNLNRSENNILLNKPISFGLPLPAITVACAQPAASGAGFAILPGIQAPTASVVKPKSAIVYWDASGSLATRDIEKEKSFLQDYISTHNIQELTIIPFNHQLLDSAHFEPAASGKSWKEFLDNIVYDGATQLGLIDLDRHKADMTLIFTDGYSTFGRSKPKPGNTLVYCISATPSVNTEVLNSIVNKGGGSFINLLTTLNTKAVEQTSRAKNWLMNITSASGKANINTAFPIALKPMNTIYGTMENSRDTLTLIYGYGNTVTYTEKISLASNSQCGSQGTARMPMFYAYNKMVNTGDWNRMLEFGLAERIVTLNSAFIVLERVEDYVKYNIAPPKELEEECAKLGYVRKDTRQERMQMAKQSEEQRLNQVIAYRNQLRATNQMYKDYYSNPQNRIYEDRLMVTDNVKRRNVEPMAVFEKAEITNGLDAVVVTSINPMQKSTQFGSRVISAGDLQGATVSQMLQGKVGGTAGSATNVQIRGINSIKPSNNPLYIVDGVATEAVDLNQINPATIRNIEILRSPTAMALYGHKAQNGVILINIKKDLSYNFSGSYKLKHMEDVEYVTELKSASKYSKLKAYRVLQQANKNNTAFYLDVADIFFESGMNAEALSILQNAAEASGGSVETKISMAYILEKNHQAGKAIEIYIQLLNEAPKNLSYHRSLAWLYFQQGNHQQAVDILSNAIKLDLDDYEYAAVSYKALMLNDLNAMLSAQKGLDVSDVPTEFIDSAEADIRVVIEYNSLPYSGLATVREPGNKSVSANNYSPNAKGTFSQGYSSDSRIMEYLNKTAEPGKYFVNVVNYNYAGFPLLVKLTIFRNFGRPAQTIETKVFSLENQAGDIEIDSFKWGK